MTLRHNHICNATADLFTEVCKNVRVEQQLQALSGETLSEKTANKSDQGRADVNAHGFWLTDQVAFFDVRIYNPTVKRYVHHQLRKLYEVNEKEKKSIVMSVSCKLSMEPLLH